MTNMLSRFMVNFVMTVETGMVWGNYEIELRDAGWMEEEWKRIYDRLKKHGEANAKHAAYQICFRQYLRNFLK